MAPLWTSTSSNVIQQLTRLAGSHTASSRCPDASEWDLRSVGRFVERLVVEELKIRPDQVFGDVQNTLDDTTTCGMDDTALAHLHDLQHFFIRFGRGAAVSAGEVAHLRRLAGCGEDPVVFIAQLPHLIIFKKLANDCEPSLAKEVDLLLRQAERGGRPSR